VLRFWTKDKPVILGWEEILAANALAVGAVASAIIEGSGNLDFITWDVAALALAAPVVFVQDKVVQAGRRAAARSRSR